MNTVICKLYSLRLINDCFDLLCSAIGVEKTFVLILIDLRLWH